MKIALLAAGALLALILLFHDLPFAASAQGRCMAQVQPSVLVGMSPGWMTQLDCAVP